MIVGLQHVRKLEASIETLYAVQPHQLAEAVAADLQQGLKPFYFLGTIGELMLCPIPYTYTLYPSAFTLESHEVLALNPSELVWIYRSNPGLNSLQALLRSRFCSTTAYAPSHKRRCAPPLHVWHVCEDRGDISTVVV